MLVRRNPKTRLTTNQALFGLNLSAVNHLLEVALPKTCLLVLENVRDFFKDGRGAGRLASKQDG